MRWGRLKHGDGSSFRWFTVFGIGIAIGGPYRDYDLTDAIPKIRFGRIVGAPNSYYEKPFRWKIEFIGVGYLSQRC
jgi:hypothetical protein